MFIDLLSEFCEEGGISLLGNGDEPIFRGYILPDQPEFLVIFYKRFHLTLFSMGGHYGPLQFFLNISRTT